MRIKKVLLRKPFLGACLLSLLIVSCQQKVESSLPGSTPSVDAPVPARDEPTVPTPTPPSTPEVPGTPPLPGTPTPIPGITEDKVDVYFMPNLNGHVDFIRLANAATKSINLVMFMITNTEDAEALIAAAKRQVKVRVILDNLMLNGPMNLYIKNKLVAGGVQVKASSAGFTISHEKSMTIDGVTAMISTINLTKTYDTNRGIGVISKDSEIIAEFDRVFEADWVNADRGSQDTPVLTSEKLVWSPINSTSKLVELIQSAKVSIEVYVENFGSENIANALIVAAGRGVKVRVLTPLCDENPDKYYNWPMMKTLASNRVQAKMMNAPATVTTPYIHAKSLLVDGVRSYVGSINFTSNSLVRSREVGIIFTNSSATKLIQEKFDADWIRAMNTPSSTEGYCAN